MMNERIMENFARHSKPIKKVYMIKLCTGGYLSSSSRNVWATKSGAMITLYNFIRTTCFMYPKRVDKSACIPIAESWINDGYIEIIEISTEV